MALNEVRYKDYEDDEKVTKLPFIGVTFAGGSCLIKMGNQALELKDYLDENVEDVVVINA